MTTPEANEQADRFLAEERERWERIDAKYAPVTPDHLAEAQAALDRIAITARAAAQPGLSGVTVHRYLLDIARDAAEAAVHLAALGESP